MPMAPKLRQAAVCEHKNGASGAPAPTSCSLLACFHPDSLVQCSFRKPAPAKSLQIDMKLPSASAMVWRMSTSGTFLRFGVFACFTYVTGFQACELAEMALLYKMGSR